MTQPLERLFEAADNHAEDSGEPDHAVGDLQDLLRAAWALMRPSQRLALLQGDAAEAIVETGAREAFTAAELAAQIEAELATMEAEVVAAGYSFMEGECGFSWTDDNEDSLYFEARCDAVQDAYRHLKGQAPA